MHKHAAIHEPQNFTCNAKTILLATVWDYGNDDVVLRLFFCSSKIFTDCDQQESNETLSFRSTASKMHNNIKPRKRKGAKAQICKSVPLCILATALRQRKSQNHIFISKHTRPKGDSGPPLIWDLPIMPGCRTKDRSPNMQAGNISSVQTCKQLLSQLPKI